MILVRQTSTQSLNYAECWVLSKSHIIISSSIIIMIQRQPHNEVHQQGTVAHVRVD